MLDLTEALHWEKRARDEGAEGLVQLQQDHAHQKALVLQTGNELEAATGQLGKKTEALDHQCKVNDELRAEIRRLQDQVAGKEAALSQTSEQLEYKESENSLLKVSVTQALNEQRLAQECANSKDEEAAKERIERIKVEEELVQVRSSTWEGRGAASLEPTPREAGGSEGFSARGNTQRSPRYSYKKGLF